MPTQACTIHNLTIQFNDQPLFKEINFHLIKQQCSSLIGANGQGKSLLLSLLAHHSSLPSFAYGKIMWNVPFAYLPQDHTNMEPQKNIADALGISTLYQAFLRIEQGIATLSDYDLTENLWHLPIQWQQHLTQAKLPTDLSIEVNDLSPGQKTKLALSRLFLLEDHYLLLDEPSNHLDQESREWLIQQVKNHPAGCLIVSHDRDLLNQIHHTFVLDHCGLTEYQCNYFQYKQHYNSKLNALKNEIKHHVNELSQLDQQQKVQQERAIKQNKIAKSKHRSGKEPDKLIFNAKKSQAQKTQAKHTQQYLDKRSVKVQLFSEKKNLIEKIKPQSFLFRSGKKKNTEILRLNHVTLPNCHLTPIHFSLTANEKLHLKGTNGVGKSTLLKFIHHNYPSSGEIFKSAQTFYLDQNFSLLKLNANAIENLKQFNHQLTDQEFRTELGKIRLGTYKALIPISQLSGGERLKIALLCIALCQNPIELLLLDEPDNHLDIESKILFAHAIRSFSGAVILVSHDSHFVKECDITESLSLSSSKVIDPK